MSFIIGKDCIAAVKSENIEAIFIRKTPEERLKLVHPDGYEGQFGYSVNVLFNGDSTPLILTEFISGNINDDYGMAKAYFAELVDKLNGGEAL